MAELKLTNPVKVAEAINSTQAPSKSYVDAQLATKLDIAGGALVGAINTTPVILSIVSGEVVMDCSLSNVFALTLTGDTEILPPIGASTRAGSRVLLIVVNEGTWQLTFPDNFIFMGDPPNIGESGESVSLIDMVISPYDPAIFYCVGMWGLTGGGGGGGGGGTGETMVFGGTADPNGNQTAVRYSIYNQLDGDGHFVRSWVKTTEGGNGDWE